MVKIWIAFLIDWVLGDPLWFPHPVRWIGKYITGGERVVRRLASTPRGLRGGGVLLAVSTIGLTYGASYGLLVVAGQIHPWLYDGVNLVLLWTCLAPRSLQREADKVYKILEQGDLPGARTLLSYIVGRDTEGLGEEEIVRATVETVAENTSDGVIAPLFYMFLGGAPLALVYKAINTLDSMVGYNNEDYRYLGWASARIDDGANYVPARITGVLLVWAAALTGLDSRESWRIMVRDHENHASPNAGYPEAAVAGALGVSLGGTNYYFGQPVIKPIIGEGRRGFSKKQIRVTVRLMYLSTVLALLLMTGLCWLVS